MRLSPAVECARHAWRSSSVVSTRRWLQAVLAKPSVSSRVTPVVKPFASSLSAGALLRVPVTRIVEVRSPLCDSPIFLDPAGVDPIASLLYWWGPSGWEPETLSIFLRLVVAGSTVVDVGANTGLFSLLAARRAPNVSVHAIEPVPRVFTMLEDNVSRNSPANIRCHQLAFSDNPGTVSMYVPREALPIMASMLPHWRSDSERVEVTAQTLDQFAVGLESRIDVLKIDTEGTEALVLAGGTHTLATHRPFIICEVLAAGRTADDLTSLMVQAGYSIFSLEHDGPQATDHVLGNEAEGCRNYLFIPQSRMQEAHELLGV